MNRAVRALILTLAFVTPTFAEQNPAVASASDSTGPYALPDNFAGPPPPVAPAVMARDETGRVTVRAARTSQPLRIDGQFDEAIYRELQPITGMVQVEPDFGAPATERTEIWLSFDDDHLYVSVRCWDESMDRLVATEMRRDSTLMFQGNDIISIIFDPFYDRRNSLAFTVNPLGGRSDGQIINERQYSSDWNPVWNLKTGRFDGGWTVEAAYPFKSLRYRPGRDQVWGFNLLRIKRSKNEIMSLTRVPPARGAQAVQQASNAATMVGLEVPAAGRTLDLKPFATSNVTTDVASRIDNDPGGKVGVDAKYSITQNITTDVTVNTDFAQVEADEQQVNLTRFSLFFPEKREFFLENQGTFSFGGVPIGGLNAGGMDAPMLFYSRRIGLNRNQEVPIIAGGRVNGRSGPFTFGAVNIQTGDEEKTATESTNFTVVRVKRDILGRSSIGLIGTNRSVGVTNPASNQAYGADATFSFLQNLQFNTYWAKTSSPGRPGRDTSYRAQMDYPGDRYAVQLERLAIGRAFNPEVGYVRRNDMVRDYAMFRFSPRPARRGRVRKWVYQANLEYIENDAGRLESRERQAEFAVEFQNADRFTASFTDSFEFLPLPSRISGILLPVGGYRFRAGRLNYNMGQQRPLSANVAVEYGTFYNGHKLSLGVSRGRLNLTPQLSFEPTYSLNRVEFLQGETTTHLAGTRVTFTMTPLMFASALIQYNSFTSAVSTNARLRWEYRPGSELFIVYNDERNTLTPGFPDVSARALIVKINRLFRF